MPAYSTHYIFAKEMMPKLYELADFELNENAVYIGTQGPDIFFFHRVLPQWKGKSRRDVGSEIHRGKFGNMLELMRNYCNESSPAPDIAKKLCLRHDSALCAGLHLPPLRLLSAE